MSVSNVLTPNSHLSTPRSANSNFNFTEVDKVKKTSGVVKEISLAIIFGILAAVGAVSIGIGTAASFGTLPLFLIMGGTLISALIAKIGLIYAVAKICTAERKEGAEAIEMDGELPKIKLADTAFLQEIDQYENLCTFIDEGTAQEGKEYEIHPRFERDCMRDRFNVSLNGQTLYQLFFEQFSQMEALEQTRSSLQKQADESGDVAIQTQADEVDEKLTACKAGLPAKLVEGLSCVVAEKLGGNSPLLAPISLALCQDLRIMLENKMHKLSLENYKGNLIHRAVDPKISYTSALEFPQEGDIVAKITVNGSGQFKAFMSAEGGKMSELETPCDYKGTSFIYFDRTGKTSIESTVQLSPQKPQA